MNRIIKWKSVFIVVGCLTIIVDGFINFITEKIREECAHLKSRTLKKVLNQRCGMLKSRAYLFNTDCLA